MPLIDMHRCSASKFNHHDLRLKCTVNIASATSAVSRSPAPAVWLPQLPVRAPKFADASDSMPGYIPDSGLSEKREQDDARTWNGTSRPLSGHRVAVDPVSKIRASMASSGRAPRLPRTGTGTFALPGPESAPVLPCEGLHLTASSMSATALLYAAVLDRNSSPARLAGISSARSGQRHCFNCFQGGLHHNRLSACAAHGQVRVLQTRFR